MKQSRKTTMIPPPSPDGCRYSDNGNGQCRRSEQIDTIERELSDERRQRREGERQIVEAVGVLITEVSNLTRAVNEMQRSVGPVRDTIPSSSFSEGDITAVQDRPVLVARTKIAESRSLSLEEENAALRATIEATERERRRNSDRVAAADDRRWSKWQKVGAGILALLAALGGGAGLAQLFGG